MIQTHERQIIRELGDGLVLRRATPDDADKLAAYNSLMLRDPGVTEPDMGIAAWTRDLMMGKHPTMRAGDFTLVENTRTREIVSSVNLISQTWTYDGIPFGVGRPELVSTHPDYRRRGLIREQFSVLHEWSAQRGELVQVITGIPWYYRQFGYEMAINLEGGRTCAKSQIPKLKEGESEAYHLRAANDADVEFIAGVYEFACARSLLATVRDVKQWQYELAGRTPVGANRFDWYVVAARGGERVGLVRCLANERHGSVIVLFYELAPNMSWLDVTPGVLRGLIKVGEEYKTRHQKEFDSFNFMFGAEHPLYQTLPSTLARMIPLYAYYVRVPDVPAFVRTIAPVLEKRLARSIAVGHSGELKINFYRDGLHIEFENGRVKNVAAWTPPTGDDGNAAFPDLTFLHLLFGHRTMEELRFAYPDCWTDSDRSNALLNILFPKLASSVWAVS